MDHSASCRCHVVAASDRRKAETAWGHASDGLVRVPCLAAWPSDSRLPLTNSELPFFQHNSPAVTWLAGRQVAAENLYGPVLVGPE